MKANSLVLGTLLLANVLDIMIAPYWMLWIRPDFTLIVLCYWVLALPERYGLIFSTLIGFFQDSLTASILGTHMLIYLLAGAFILFSYQRLRMMSVWQQAFLLFFILLGAQLLELWLGYVSGTIKISMTIIMPALIGSLLWPWLMVVLRSIRRKSGVTNRFI